jgi:hypothetical protein
MRTYRTTLRILELLLRKYTIGPIVRIRWAVSPSPGLSPSRVITSVVLLVVLNHWGLFRAYRHFGLWMWLFCRSFIS